MNLEIEEFDIDLFVRFTNTLCNLLGHNTSPVPHSIINNRYLVFLVMICPLHISFNNLLRFVTPDDAMARTNDIKGQLEG